MKSKVAILLWAADPDQPHLCATPFFHAAAAAAMDAEVEIYFTSRSVKLLVQGVAASLPTGPLKRETVYAFMRRAAEHGAKFYACSHAMQEHGVVDKDFIPEVTGIAGAAVYMARCMDEQWVAITY
ncbi:MAG: DsrE family protein [Burkholderiales bacterium]